MVIHLFDENRQVLQPVAVHGIVQPDTSGLDMRPGEGVAGQAIENNIIINVEDVYEDARCLVRDVETNMRSLLVAPVGRGTNCFGTISVTSVIRGAFSAKDESLLSSLGTEAAIAIKNARLYQQEKSQRLLAEALEEAAFSFNLSLDLEKVLELILDQLLRVVPCRTVNVLLIKGESAYVVQCRESTGSPDGKNLEYVQDLPLTLRTLQQMMRTKQPLVIPNVQEFPGWVVTSGWEWVRSYASAPLMVEQQIIGFLNVDSDKLNFFTEETKHILQAFAAHAAVAIQNARLYRDLANVLAQEKAMRAQLLQADKLTIMGRMATSVAHEVNNPLQAIQGCLERAQATAGEPENVSKYLTLARQEMERLTGILQGILDFQRPAQGTRTKVDVPELMEDMLNLYAKRLQAANVKVELDFGKSIPAISAYESQIKQVFLNLLLNAVDAMPSGGTLKISIKVVKDRGRWLQVCFADTGKGIPPDVIEHIFEPFISTKPRGTGLGLWVSHTIVAAHEGRITAQSSPGKGSTFTVWFPV